MPKDDERKEMTQEEIDAREEKFRTFFTTSVAQVPEEMTRRDDENEEKPKSLLGRLFRREKGEQPEGGTPEESRTGEIQLGGEEPEEPSDLELVLTLEEEVAEPKPEQPKPTEPVSAPQPEPEKPQKPAEPIKAPEPPAPKPEKKPAEKQAAPRKKAVQYEPRTPQEQYEDREMQALKAMLFGAKLPPQEEEPPQPVKPAEPEKSTPQSRSLQRNRTQKKSRMRRRRSLPCRCPRWCLQKIRRRSPMRPRRCSSSARATTRKRPQPRPARRRRTMTTA